MSSIPTSSMLRSAEAATSASARRPVSPVRWLLATAGVGCVGMAGLGAVLPGLPTTVFLIMAVWCFTRSCPWLTDRLVRTRLFRPFLKYLEPGTRMPRRAKVITISVMWAAITLSCTLLVSRGVPTFVPVLVALSGGAGTWCIARQGRIAQHSG